MKANHSTMPAGCPNHREAGTSTGRLANVLEAIGNTPLVRLNRVVAGLRTAIYAKLEYMNPGGSIKDRMAVYVLEKAMAEGKLGPNTVIVEATSGNTGVAVAMFGAVHGRRVIVTIPDKMSSEKVDTLRAYGAEVHICPTAVPPESPESHYNVAIAKGREAGDYFLLNQYENPDNPEAHYHLTGPEIWRQTDGKIDILVGGVGTGGTMSGCAKFLKEQNPNLIAVAVDPYGSVYGEYAESGKLIEPKPYLVEGIGEDKLCPTLRFEYIDQFIKVTDKDCFAAARELAAGEGILTGGSGGAAIHGALTYAREHDGDQMMVVILPDSGLKYLSRVYNDRWMRQHGMVNENAIRPGI